MFILNISVCVRPKTNNRYRLRHLEIELKRPDEVGNKDTFDYSELQQQRQDDITDSKKGLLP